MKIRGIQDRLNEIMSQVNNSPLVQQHRLDNIITALDHIISANNGCEKLPNSLKEFKKTEKMSSVAKNVLQPRFRSTNKNPGRKTKKPLSKPSQQEKDQLKGKINQEMEQEPSDSQGQRSGPSVAPYPPLRLVPTTEPTVLQPQSQGPIINPTTAQGLPSWFRIPPSLYNKKITIKQSDGKTQDIVFTGGQNSTNVE